MFQNISVKEALQLALDYKALLIDIRTEEEFRKGHLPTAVWVSEENLREMLRKETELSKILYCNYGNYSLRLALELAEEGYEIYSIVGGYHAYEGYVERKKDQLWTMEWKHTGAMPEQNRLPDGTAAKIS